MRFRFRKGKLRNLYYEEEGAEKYSAEVANAFFEVMGVIEAARDERDLYALKGLHYEKLKGERKGDRWIRLTKQFRLALTVERDEKGKYLEIVKIEKH